MFECKKNCGLCCGPVPIKKETYEKNIAKAQTHVLTDLGTHVLALQGVTAKCAFLTDEMKCAIYEERPAVCRIFGQTDALPCPFLTKEGCLRNRKSRRKVEKLEDKRLKQFKKKMEGDNGI